MHFNPKMLCLCLILGIGIPLSAQEVSLELISSYATGVFDEGAAEIVAHDAQNQQLFFVNGDNKSLDVLDISNPAMPTLVRQIDIQPYGGNLNSVDVFGNIVAVAVENDNKQADGVVAFFDTDGNFLNTAPAGALPDMLTFNADGTLVIVANEGEPDDDYVVDPEGSVTIVDLSNGVAAATSRQVTFEAFNDKKMSLINRGVRIFGNNGLASVAQDLEPEFITLSPDGSLAFVGLQENNALAVVDLAQGEVVDILALGYKDHSKGSPQLREYFLDEIPWWPDLGTPIYEGAETVKLGGFSGLYYDPITSTDFQYSFWAVPDRGPNEDAVSRTLAGTTQNLRPFKLPNYQARIEKLIYITSLDMFFIDANPIMLKMPDGTPISGRGNIPGFDEIPVTRTDANVYTNVDYEVDGVQYHELEYDAFGGDFEGIVRTSDFTYWMCDEYRPAIYHFDANGVLMDRFVPRGTSQLGDQPQPEGTYGAETLPEVYSKRRANRGFEALAWDYDENILYAFIQTPLYNPDNSTRNNSDVIRILGIDPANGQPVREYVYLLERNRDAGVGLSRVDKIGDAVYKGKGQFYVLERDSSNPDDGNTGKKYVYEINLTGATNILGTDLSDKSTSNGPDDKTLEMMTADDLAEAGVRTVHKTKVLNLPSIGYLPSDKPEGLALLPDGRLVVVNDNDFGLAGAGVSDKISMGFIEFQGDYGFDASNRDDDIEITSRPTLGMYQPDAITSYEVDGKGYILTANEGDARDYDGYSEEDRVADLLLNPVCFPDADQLQDDEDLGRLNTTLSQGDLDMDGFNEIIYSYGARSFSIWDENGNLIFDSGDQFAQIIAANPDFAPYFNSNNDDNDSFKSRSDDKGIEPEAIAVAELDGETYAFIGLERMGGIMIYNISDPFAPYYVNYINNRNFEFDAESTDAGDLGVEDIIVIKADDSPNGRTLLVTANEVSGTVSLFGLDTGASSNSESFAQAAAVSTGLSAYPNPFISDMTLDYTLENNSRVRIALLDAYGRELTQLYSGEKLAGSHQLLVNFERYDLPKGLYMITLQDGENTRTVSVVKQ